MKKTYTVICPFDENHEFLIVVEIKDESSGVENTLEEYCPFCEKFVQVEVQGELEKMDRITRRQLGFD